MSWLLLLSGAKRLGSTILGFLSKLSVWQLALLAVSIFALVQHFELVSSRHTATKWHNQFTAEHKAREADRKAYSDAQAAAKAKNEAQIQRTANEQQRISDETTSNLRARLERLRSELRNPAAKGSASGPGASQDGNPAPGATREAGLCLAPKELLRAAENEERHDRLIDWVIQQSRVDPNK